MIRYELRPETGTAAVTFAVQDEALVGAVAVVGDFNNWDPTAHTMEPYGDDRRWTTTVSVPVGRRYAFRYLAADGTWLNDSDPHGWVDNGMGGHNGVLDLSRAGEDAEPHVPGLDEPTASMAPESVIPPISDAESGTFSSGDGAAEELPKRTRASAGPSRRRRV